MYVSALRHFYIPVISVPMCNDQLIAAQHSTEEIRKMIGADSLGYMQIDYLEGMAGGLPLCKACFDGNYPMEIQEEIKQD